MLLWRYPLELTQLCRSFYVVVRSIHHGFLVHIPWNLHRSFVVLHKCSICFFNLSISHSILKDVGLFCFYCGNLIRNHGHCIHIIYNHYSCFHGLNYHTVCGCFSFLVGLSLRPISFSYPMWISFSWSTSSPTRWVPFTKW